MLVCGPEASRVSESRRPGLLALWHVASSWAQIEPIPRALAGGFLTTGPPGKSFLLCSDHLPSQISGRYLGS